MPKSPDAFRTISEVADWLGVQAHVLRFWESKFAQIKPIKRAGGRRYYRPTDMLLIGGIKKLLHEDGLTIKGAQKMLRENGIAFVSDMSPPLDDLTIAVIEGTGETVDESVVNTTAAPEPIAVNEPVESPVAVEESQPAIQFDAPETPAREEEQQRPEADAPALEVVPQIDEAPMPPPEPPAAQSTEPPEPYVEPAPIEETQTPEIAETPVTAEAAPPDPEVAPAPEAPTETTSDSEIPGAEDMGPIPSFRARRRTEVDAEPAAADTAPAPAEDAPQDAMPEDVQAASVSTDPPDPPPPPPPPPPEPEPEPEQTADAPKPREIDVPPVPDASEIEVAPSVLSALAHLRQISPETAAEIKPWVARLNRLRAGLASAAQDANKD